jgi:hypothetical protein
LSNSASCAFRLFLFLRFFFFFGRDENALAEDAAAPGGALGREKSGIALDSWLVVVVEEWVVVPEP